MLQDSLPLLNRTTLLTLYIHNAMNMCIAPARCSSEVERWGFALKVVGSIPSAGRYFRYRRCWQSSSPWVITVSFFEIFNAIRLR